MNLNKYLSSSHCFMNYQKLGIVPYGSFIDATLSNSGVQRTRLFKKYGMRCVISPQNFVEKYRHRLLGLCINGFALDNGAYICHTHNTEFPTQEFLYLCEKYGEAADWIAIPDILGKGQETLAKVPYWIKEIKKRSPNAKLLLVWQDGMSLSDIEPYTKQGIGVFVGGTTEGKIKYSPHIAKLCKINNVWCHIGRVNTKKRVDLCINWQARSFDGSGWSRFICTLMHLENVINERKKNKIKSILNKKLIRTWTKDFQTRKRIMNIEHQEIVEYFQNASKVNINGVGLPKGKRPDQYPILWKNYGQKRKTPSSS